MSDIIRPIVIIVVVLLAVLTVAAGLIWLERRLLALWQDRYGPNRVGPFGLLQVLADMIKIFTKEDWIPPFADKAVFVLAPAIVVTTTLLSFAVVAFAPGIVVADLNVGLLFFLAMSSLGVYSVVLAGWSSNNKYSLLGGLRAAGQMLSYEVFMGLSLMGVVMLAGSFNLSAIVEAQRRLWFCVPQILGLVIFVVAGLAETRRIPFDLPEAENELVAGYHAEYSGMKFGMFFLGRIRGHHADFRHDRDAVLRRLAGAVAAAAGLVHAQDVGLHRRFHSRSRVAAAAAIRPTDVAGLEGDAAAGFAEPGGHGRRLVGRLVA